MSTVKPRRKTRQVMIGDVAVGGDAPISVQSMTNTKTEDVEATVAQIKGLEKVGCEIVRVAVPGKAAVMESQATRNLWMTSSPLSLLPI